MELGEYLSAGFRHMLKGKTYLAALITSIVMGVILGIIALIAFASIGLDTITNAIMGNDPMLILSILGGVMVSAVIFLIIASYLKSVISVFIIKKIDADESNKDESIFAHLSESFGSGLKLFIASIIYGLALAIVILICVLVSLIPFVGIIIAILISIFLALYVPIGMLAMVGEISSKGDLANGLKKAFTIQFKKPILMLYGIVFWIVLLILLIIIALISMIPILGQLIVLFTMPLITIFVLSLAYNIAKE